MNPELQKRLLRQWVAARLGDQADLVDIDAHFEPLARLSENRENLARAYPGIRTRLMDLAEAGETRELYGPWQEDKNTATATEGGSPVSETEVQKAEEANAAPVGRLIKRTVVRKHNRYAARAMLAAEYVGKHVAVFLDDQGPTRTQLDVHDFREWRALVKSLGKKLTPLYFESLDSTIKAQCEAAFDRAVADYRTTKLWPKGLPTEKTLAAGLWERRWKETTRAPFSLDIEDLAKFALGFRGDMEMERGHPPTAPVERKPFSFDQD